jgi:hypothetical protein
MLNHLAQTNGRDDLKNAHHDRPGRNEQKQQQRCHPRPEEGHHPGGDAQQAHDQQGPERPALIAHAAGGDQRQHTIHEGIGAPGYNQDYQGEAGPGKGQQAEQHSGHTTQHHPTPVASQEFQHCDFHGALHQEITWFLSLLPWKHSRTAPRQLNARAETAC